MKKVLIIEDDFYNAYRLKNLIREIDDTIEVHGPLKMWKKWFASCPKTMITTSFSRIFA